jgi:hypothetical protein
MAPTSFAVNSLIRSTGEDALGFGRRRTWPRYHLRKAGAAPSWWRSTASLETEHTMVAKVSKWLGEMWTVHLSASV